jgi:ABC-type glutathione transport system ATPase component
VSQSEEPTEIETESVPDTDYVVRMEDVEVHFENQQSILDYFSDPEVVQAVDGVDLEIEENDLVALIGESGCGKTTLGKTAIGIQRPTGGSVKYRGQDVWDAKDNNGEVTVPHKEIRRSLQIIHQDPGSSLNPNKTVKSALASPLKVWEPDMTAEDRQARIYGMLERVAMKPAADYAKREREVVERSRYLLEIEEGNGRRLRLRRCPVCETPLGPSESPAVHLAEHDWADLEWARARNRRLADASDRPDAAADEPASNADATAQMSLGDLPTPRHPTQSGPRPAPGD